jgi:hypothetical protein
VSALFSREEHDLYLRWNFIVARVFLLDGRPTNGVVHVVDSPSRMLMGFFHQRSHVSRLLAADVSAPQRIFQEAGFDK